MSSRLLLLLDPHRFASTSLGGNKRNHYLAQKKPTNANIKKRNFLKSPCDNDVLYPDPYGDILLVAVRQKFYEIVRPSRFRKNIISVYYTSCSKMKHFAASLMLSRKMLRMPPTILNIWKSIFLTHSHCMHTNTSEIQTERRKWL